ncbi:hypothetical protein GCM10007874_29050 [Labrys miyagiensis]|uniref:Uncharacterized protein n=1 Tax=Labrys miyagiensis TaxID=346912 RepID=A0ABQ6CI12_9HYPH|nr:hypothetical protein GCM10007874_29050 [Labrys miyagiensis]
MPYNGRASTNEPVFALLLGAPSVDPMKRALWASAVATRGQRAKMDDHLRCWQSERKSVKGPSQMAVFQATRL